jgi:hypothetical protein
MRNQFIDDLLTALDASGKLGIDLDNARDRAEFVSHIEKCPTYKFANPIFLAWHLLEDNSETWFLDFESYEKKEQHLELVPILKPVLKAFRETAAAQYNLF